MNKQTLSIEQVKELQSIGLKNMSDASMCRVSDYYDDSKKEWIGHTLKLASSYKGPYPEGKCIPALTFYDILDMLNKNKSRYQVCVNYSYNLIKLIQDTGYEPVETVVEFYEDNIMTSAFKAVKWCLDNNEFEF